MTSAAIERKDATEREAPPRVDYLASLRLAVRFAEASRGKFLTTILMAILGVALQLAPIWAIYRLLAALIAGRADWSMVVTYAAVAFLGVLLGAAAMGAALKLSHAVAFDILYRIRLAIARHMARLPLGYFADQPSGHAKKLIIDDPERLELIIAHGLPEGGSALATWVAVSIWLFVMDWRMALAAIFVTPVSFILLTIAMRRGSRRAPAYQAAQQRMNAAVIEFIAGMPVVKIFNRTGERFAETSAAVHDYNQVQLAWSREYLALGGAFNGLILANIVFILPLGLFLMAAGQLDFLTLLFFILLGSSYSHPLLKLFNQFHELAHLSVASTLVAEILDTAPQPDSATQIVLPHHRIVFEDVFFGYDARDVLHGVNFIAEPGEVTALVGPSGSGKSTIANLIPRFFDVRTGRITLGGIDVRDIPLAQLMDAIAFVFQNTVLFSDTIAANIRFGKPSATDAEVEAAARAAQAHEFILALPAGYQTQIGSMGRLLSGGERQRIAIARAILKDAPVIVLDEATAFADPDHETAIQAAIEALTLNRTLIVVAHRLHTIAAADKIIVLEGGRIAESGKHADLLAQGGLFTKLWNDYTIARAMPPRPERRPERHPERHEERR